jgi:hypothetical protein
MSMILTLGGPATGKKFYPGRQIYVDELVAKLNTEGQEAIYLLGPRRIGKTSIVKEYFRQRNIDNNDEGAYLYFYCAEVTNIVEFYNTVNDQIVKELKQAGDINKFQELTLRLGTTVDGFANSIRLALKKFTIKGNGVELNDPKEWEIYKDHVNKLKDEFIALLGKFGMKRIVLGFDEVPEAIQTILKERKDIGVKEIHLWLEHFREIRQAGTVKVQMILFGSVNVKLTLENLGLTNLVNDGNTIDVLPLNTADSQKLFWELVEGQKIEDLIKNNKFVDSFLKDKFTHSSPWAVQNYVNEYIKLKEKTDLDTDLKESYLKLFDIQGGTRYFRERFKKYYGTDEISKIEHIITFIVSRQIDGKQERVDVKEIFENYKAKFQDSEWKDFKVILDILMLDNIIVRKVDHYSVQNTVEKNFWYQQFVGHCKL